MDIAHKAVSTYEQVSVLCDQGPISRLCLQKHRIGAYGSREFCANGKRTCISQINGEFWLLHVPTQRYQAFYTYKASAEIRHLYVIRECDPKRRIRRYKQSHEFGPCTTKYTVKFFLKWSIFSPNGYLSQFVNRFKVYTKANSNTNLQLVMV